MDFLKGPLDSRLYVDLIYQATSRYASFSPSSGYELGDYGHIERATGEFIAEGNLLKRYPEIKQEVGQPRETPEANKVFFKSRAHGAARDLSVDASIPNIADCELKAGWAYEKDRHAALVMIDPVLVEIPYEGNIRRFLLARPKLKNKVVVTKLYKCTSYAIFLANGKSGLAYFGFNASVPTPLSAVIQAGAGAHIAWTTHGESGSWSTGLYEPQVFRYVPLLTLKAIRPVQPASGFRGHPETFLPPPEPEELPPAYRPWGELDEEGQDLDEGESESESIDSDDGPV